MADTDYDILTNNSRGGFREVHADISDHEATVILQPIIANVTTRHIKAFKERFKSIFICYDIERRIDKKSKVYKIPKKSDSIKKISTLIANELRILEDWISKDELNVFKFNDLHIETRKLLREEYRKSCIDEYAWSCITEKPALLKQYLKVILPKIEIVKTTSREDTPLYKVICGLGQLYFDLTKKLPKRSHDYMKGESGDFLSFVRICFEKIGIGSNGRYSASVRRYIETDAKKIHQGVEQP